MAEKSLSPSLTALKIAVRSAQLLGPYAVLEDCKAYGADVIVQAGWLTVLAGEVLNVYEGKILIQKRVPVMPGDDPDSLYARIAPQEHQAIVEGLLMLCK